MLTEQFLTAIRDQQITRAHALVVAHPEIGRFSVHTAAAVGDVGALREHLAANSTLATRPTLPDGTEPIVYAVQNEIKDRLGVTEAAQLDCVRALLDAGANPNAAVPPGYAWTPNPVPPIPVLYFPCVSGREPLARLLLERGANPNDGESVYHAAQHDHRACLETLLEFGADLSSVHADFGNTPLYFLATHRESNPISAAVTRGMAWLLEHGADPNVASHTSPKHQGSSSAGERPLHRIAISGRGGDVARLLVSHGALVDAPRYDGRAAYVLAVRAGNTEVARFLADCGADRTQLKPVDELLGACAIGDAERARALVGAHPDLMSMLNAEERHALGDAINDNRAASIAVMLEVGWPLDGESEWGGTPLHVAAWHGRLALVEQLIAAGAPINVRDSNYGSSPIAWAAHGSTNAGHDRDDDYVAIVHALLDAGATRVESYNRWNESPESMASVGVHRAFKARGFTV